jgi:hypothetical protein
MFSLLKNIIELVEYLPLYFLYVIETVANLFFSLIESLFAVATSFISLPPVPGPPEYITAINWFFPIGAIVSIMIPIVGGYITFLSIRYILKFTGNL